MKRMTKLEHDLMNIMRTSTDPQEIIETAAKLGPEPWTMEEAEELAEINKPVEEKALPHMTQEHFDSLLALQMATTEEEVRGAVDNLPLLTEDEKKELVEKILKGGE